MIGLEELIPSKDVRAYMKQIGHTLTDFEKAVLIYKHSEMCHEEKCTMLKELMELTDDSNLREEIRERLSCDELCLSSFHRNDGTFIYKLQIYDPQNQGYYEEGYYKSGELAVVNAKKFRENFAVQKITLLTEEREEDDDNLNCS